MSISTIQAADGTPLYVPGGVDDLTEDDVESLRRKGRVVGFDDGRLDITWAFWEPQREAIQAVYSGEYDIVGFVAGYRSGKSVTGARVVWETALDPRFGPTRSLAMGTTYAEAKKTTYPVLFEELPGARHEELDPFLYDGDPENSPIVTKFSKQDGTITLFNDSVVVLASADKPDRYKGGKFSLAWCDEFAHYKSNRIHGIRKTITERFDFGDPAVMVVTTTGNGHNPAQKILQAHEDENGNPLGSKIRTVTASSLNNPFLTPDDRDRLRRTHGASKVARQALHGAFEAAEGQVYPFSKQAHTVELTATDDGYEATGDGRVSVSSDWRIFGYDAGWSDPRVLVEVARTDYGQYIVVDEWYEPKTHVADAIRWLADHDKPKGVIYCEHEPGDIRKFRKPSLTNIDDPPSGFRAGKADKDLDAGIDEVRHRLRADHDDRYGLLVAERCENLIGEFLSYTEDDVGGSDVDDHALDALRYAIYTESVRGASGSSSSSSGTRVEKR